MSKRISSAMVLKNKKDNLSQKSLSLSKFNSTESRIKFNPNQDYFALLTQIKNKKIKLGTPPTLFHYFVKKSAQKSINIRLNYLSKENQTSLYTEKANNKKDISFPRTSINTSIREKNFNLLENIRTETPKVPINRIFKLKEDKKVAIKHIVKKKYIPMERRDSYKNFINKMNQYNLMKYSNSNSEFVHKLKSEIYITQGNEKEKKLKKRNDQYMQYLRDKFEEEKEINDKVFYPSLELERIKKKIKSILLKEIAEKPEAFFNIFENRINFLQDSYKPPNIKNNLINAKYKDLYGYKQLFGLESFNRISKNTLNNLAKAKIRIQREKEFKLNFLNEKGKIKDKYQYYKKLSKKDIYNSKEEIEKIIYKDYYITQDDWERILKNEESLENNDNMDDFKNYFEDKYETDREVFIPDSKLKKCVFNLFENENS